MRGINHLIVTVILANIVCAYLIHPNTLIDVMLCLVGMIAVCFGSIAPDIDISRSLIRRWYMILPCLPLLGVHWLLGAIYGFKHRGVMHSLIGWSVSFAVVGALTELAFGRTVSMACCGGFAFGYMAHLIEDELTTKTAIKWLPAPKFMRSWNVGLLPAMMVVLLLVPVVGAAEGSMTGKSFDDVQKEFNDFASTVFWFGVKVVCVWGAIMAYCGATHKSVTIVKGLIFAFAIAFVLQGILIGIFT